MTVLAQSPDATDTRSTWPGDLAARWRRWVAGPPPTAAPVHFTTRVSTRVKEVRSTIARHPTMADVMLTMMMAAWTMPQLVHHARYSPSQFTAYLLFTVLLVVPMIWRRRFPLSAFAAAAVVALAHWIVGVQLAADISLLVYLFTVASRYPMRVAVLAAGVLEVGALLAAVRWPLAFQWNETFVLLSGPIVASLLFGANVRHRRVALTTLTERAEHVERDRDRQALIAAADERIRIAREMHDVVAHSLSVMVTLSEGAARKQATEPERANTAMRQVSETGREAIGEMRRLLGVLRTEDSLQSRRPQPGIGQLDGLIDQVRATGLTAELTVIGTTIDLPPGAGLTVFRIVQEALTNTLKHAVAPARVTVDIVRGPDSVTVDVHDDGTPSSNPVGTGLTGSASTRHGLTGMRERVAVFRGTVSAGPDPAGGWRIHAHLPITAELLSPFRTGSPPHALAAAVSGRCAVTNEREG